MTFAIPIEKEVTRIDKNGEEITKNISCILQFIDSARFMAGSLSNLAKTLPWLIVGGRGGEGVKCHILGKKTLSLFNYYQTVT